MASIAFLLVCCGYDRLDAQIQFPYKEKAFERALEKYRRVICWLCLRFCTQQSVETLSPSFIAPGGTPSHFLYKTVNFIKLIVHLNVN